MPDWQFAPPSNQGEEVTGQMTTAMLKRRCFLSIVTLVAGAAPTRNALALGLLAAALAAWSPPGKAAAAKPNIVLVVTDDQDDETVAHMPGVTDLVVRQGATFAHAYYNDPTCSPSRATILTGLYDHNTGVTTNTHKTFYGAGLPARTVAVALQNAGYRTALIGKYFNGYPYPAPLTY